MSMEEKRNSLTFQGFNQSILKPSNEKDISEIVKSDIENLIELIYSTLLEINPKENLSYFK